jgi:hypothetical protein
MVVTQRVMAIGVSAAVHSFLPFSVPLATVWLQWKPPSQRDRVRPGQPAAFTDGMDGTMVRSTLSASDNKMLNPRMVIVIGTNKERRTRGWL